MKSPHNDDAVGLILVVVDKDSELALFKDALARHRLLLATSESEALEHCRSEYEAGQRIHGGFFKAMLGSESGAQAIRRVLEIDTNILCTIIATPEQRLDDVKAVIADAGSWSQLKSPFTREEIRQRASGMISNWRRRRRDSDHGHILEAANTELEEAVSARTCELDEALAKLKSTNARLQSEIIERKRTEESLRLSQKLEAIGQLAAGVAHEINTPMQYISSNVYFLAEAYEDFREILARTQIAESDKELVAELVAEVPGALEGTFTGIEAISTIVTAMRGVARRDPANKEPADINAAIENTLAISRAEYRHCATLTRELGDLPSVLCHVGEISQVILNLIVNATHAIIDSHEPQTLGEIRVSTAADSSWVTIVIEDDGGGIALENQERLFDPFFTTKEVGRGTGQGLSIARRIVRDHGGTLTFTSVPGRGSSFEIRLPI